MMSAHLRSLKILALLAIMLGFVPDAAAQDDSRRPYLAGNGFLARGMNALAAEEYQSFLDATPDHPDAQIARYGLAVALQRLGHHAQALEALEFIESTGQFPFAQESRIVGASAEFALERYTDASARLLPMIGRADQDHVEAAVPMLIESLYRSGDFAQAVSTAQRVIDRFSIATLGSRASLFAALAAEQLGTHEKAIEWSSWVIKQSGVEDPSRLMAQLCLARNKLSTGSVEEAIRISEQLANSAPDEIRIGALHILAEAHRQAGNRSDADRVYATLQHEDPASERSDDILIQRGLLAFEQDRFEQALRLFEQSDDVSEEVTRWAARCEMRLNKPANAASRLASIKQPSPDTLFELGAMLKQSQDLPLSSATYERFLRHPAAQEHPNRLHARLALASIDLQSKQYDRCAQRCQSILDNSADTNHTDLIQNTRLMLAESYYLSGDIASAKPVYRDCLDRAIDNQSKPTIAYRLGMIEAQLGNHPIAETMLRSVLRGSATPPEFSPGLRIFGDLAMLQKDWPVAIRAYTDFASVQGGLDAPSNMKLGIACARTGANREAIEAFDAAIEGDLSPSDQARARLERGDVHQALDNPARAAADWQEAVKIDTEGDISTAATQRLSSMALASGDTRTASRQLRSILSASDDPNAIALAALDLGRLELQSGNDAVSAEVLSDIDLDALPQGRVGEALACTSIAFARTGDDERASQYDARLRAQEYDIDGVLLVTVLYERAWRARRTGNTAVAINSYTQLIAINPDAKIAISATLELVDLLLESGDATAAMAQLKTVTESSTVDEAVIVDASIRLGTLLYQAGEHGPAIDAFQRALDRSDPDDRALDRTRLLCGESMHHLGLWASAISQFELAARSRDGSIAEPALLRLGSSAAQIQRWSVSEAAFETHAKQYPDSAHRLTAHFGIGWARESDGDPTSAIEAYRIAAQSSSETAARAQFQIGQCFFALGEHEQAASELIKVDILYASPRWSAAALYEAGRCFDAIGDQTQARAQWERVLEIEDADQWATMARARLGDQQRPSIAVDASSPSTTNTTNDID